MKVPLCEIAKLDGAKVETVEFFGREVLVYEAEGEPKAVLNYCMHLGGPMHLEKGKLVCDWHHAEFDCRTGKRLKGPARPESRLIVLPTRVEDGTLNYEYGDP